MNNRKFYEYVNRGGGKKVITSLPGKIHKQFATDELDEMCDYIIEKGKDENVYLNPNSRRADLPPGARGSDDDITSVIAFVADVDVLGPAHKEQNLPPTKEAAIDAINEASIKPSVIVDSGYGIYAYYFFENPIDVTNEESRKYVSSLYKGFGKYLTDMFAEKGWKLDPVFNLSHMFRAPGSLNHKLDNEKPECRVTIDNGIFYSIEDFEPYYIKPVQADIPFEADAREVGSADRMYDNCAFIQKMVKEPNAVTEPEWKAELSNIVLASDGVEKAHEWSSLYDGYSYEETEAKAQQCQKAKKPCTCFYIKNTLGFQCPEGGCGVRAPIVFARYTKAEQLQNWLSKETVSVEDILEPYAIGLLAYAKDNCPVEYIKVKEVVKKAGIGLRDFERMLKQHSEKARQDAALEFDIEPTEVKLKGIDTHGAMTPKGYRISDEDGVEIIRSEEGVEIATTLCNEPLIISKCTENVDNGTEKFELSFHRNNKWKKVVISRANALNKNKIIGFADNGLPVSSDNSEGVVRYISAYEAENAKKIPFVRSINRIGWMGKEFYPYLVEGEVLYEDSEGTEIVNSLVSQGSEEVWMQTAEKLRKGTFSRVVLDASFASPLLELLQVRVIILHLWHSSRSGKTAILKFGLSIWGDPMKLMGNFNSTAVGLERRAGTLKNLPLGLDELQVLNERRLSPSLIVYSLGNGYGKTRGAKNGGLQEVPTWRNSIISTGEQPLSNENSMDGVNSRVLEIYGQPIDDAGFGREVHQISESNYGFVGKTYIEYLVNEVASDKKQMHEDFEEMRNTLNQQFALLKKGDAGVHLDTITVLALADWYSSVSVFGVAKDVAWDEAVELGIALLCNAKEQEKEDVVVRAFSYITDWIAANRTRFEKHALPCYGMVEGNQVFVIASELRNALENGGFSYTKCMKGFKERGYMDSYLDASGVERTQYQKRIQGVNVRAVCLNIKLEALYPPEEDFLGQKVVPLTGKVS